MYTKAEVIRDRKCGLKYYDKAIFNISKIGLLLEIIKLSKEFDVLNTYPRQWAGIYWALQNSVSLAIKNTKQVSQTYNFDEVFEESDIAFLKAGLPELTGNPTVIWKRKK